MNKNNKINFIGIGVTKSGTTWVTRCLVEHPDILFSSQKSTKELCFFHSSAGNPRGFTNYKNGFGWYLNQFPPFNPGKVRGEFTPTYIYDEVAAKRVFDFNPEMKILVALRNPVDMLYSLHNFTIGGVVHKLPENFEDAIKLDYFLDRGLYFKHLKKYYEIFPKENILVILLDDIKRNPNEVVKKLYRFLGVRDNLSPSVLEKKVNKTTGYRFVFIKKIVHYFIPILRNNFNKIFLLIARDNYFKKIYKKIIITNKNYSKLDPKISNKLKQYYKEDIKKLGVLIDRDLSCWQ